jgi:hypothetical protein
MVHRNIIHCALACGIALLATSCKKEITPVHDAPGPDLSTQARLMAHFHVPADAIVRDEGGWLVDGDIFVTDAIADGLGMESKQIHYGIDYRITPSNQGNITVTASGLASDWGTALGQAVDEWNAIPNSAIHITQVPAGGELTVTMDATVTSIAVADFPDGNVAPNIRINPAYNTYTLLQKKRVLVHEIGHTIGFGHTDTSNVVFMKYARVPGTGNTDYYSVMNCCNGSWPWNTAPYYGFSLWDKYLLVLTYPSSAPPSNTQPLYHYYRGDWAESFYTQTWSELGGVVAGSNALSYKRIACRTLTTQLPGSVPLLRYKWGYLHYYTRNPNAIPFNAQLEGNVGYVYLSQQPGTVPLYRYQLAGTMMDPYRSILTVESTAPAAFSVSTYQIVGYVYPPPVTPAPVWY